MYTKTCIKYLELIMILGYLFIFLLILGIMVNNASLALKIPRNWKPFKNGRLFITKDYETRTPGCATKMVKTVKLEPLAIRRLRRHLAIFYQTSQGHLSLPIEELLQPTQWQTWHTHHLHVSFQTISTKKDWSWLLTLYLNPLYPNKVTSNFQ